MQDNIVLRHVTATLAYRAAKVLRDAPSDFGTLSPATGARTPVQIVAHLADLMAWAVTLAQGEYVWKPEGSDNWATEVTRFFAALEALDGQLAARTLEDDVIEKLIQGPFADAFTHVGQLAMLRGMAGAPVKPEAYARAEIVRGRVGIEQAAPKREFDGDASARR